MGGIKRPREGIRWSAWIVEITERDGALYV